MTGLEVLFTLLGVVAVGSAVLVVTTRHLVHAALWLVVTLGAVAGMYLVLAAEFVALVQLLIYVGAVVVLLLFGLMLTRAPIGVSTDLDGGLLQRVAAAVVAGGSAGLLVTTALQGFGDARVRDLDDRVGSGAATGRALFSAWVLGFEVLSVLLLAALVAAVVVSRRRPVASDGEAGTA